MVMQWIEALNSIHWITFIQICNPNSFKSFLHFLVIHSLFGIHVLYWHSLRGNSGPKNLVVWNCMLWCLSVWQRKLLQASKGRGLLELTKIGQPLSCAVEDLKELGMSNSKFGKYIYAVSNFYAGYHKSAYDIDGTFQTKHWTTLGEYELFHQKGGTTRFWISLYTT